MSNKPKWQLDFETELYFLGNEDLLGEWDHLCHCASHSYNPRSRFPKKCNLAHKEILHRMSYGTLNRGSFNEIES